MPLQFSRRLSCSYLVLFRRISLEQAVCPSDLWPCVDDTVQPWSRIRGWYLVRGCRLASWDQCRESCHGSRAWAAICRCQSACFWCQPFRYDCIPFSADDLILPTFGVYCCRETQVSSILFFTDKSLPLSSKCWWSRGSLRRVLSPDANDQ